MSYHHPNEKLATFSTKSKEMTFPPGIGLPGSAWSSKRPEWRPDASARQFPVRKFLHVA